jgi:hypothetical protein
MTRLTDELTDLLQRAQIAFNAMSPEEKAAMQQAQLESWVRAEMLRASTKPKFHLENGVKVYHSYEDYCND